MYFELFKPQNWRKRSGEARRRNDAVLPWTYYSKLRQDLQPGAKKGIMSPKEGISMTRTNVMRLLDAAKIHYRTAEYAFDENDLSGLHAAEGIGMPPEQIFKTLVAHGERCGYAVFCIPVCCELDLKKAAKAAGDKKIELIHVKDLLATTGYIRGGCSPIGMKKPFPTYLDETAELYDEIGVSAGQRGCQILLAPADLIGYVGCGVCDLTE